jgi:hypothetical protein
VIGLPEHRGEDASLAVMILVIHVHLLTKPLTIGVVGSLTDHTHAVNTIGVT